MHTSPIIDADSFLSIEYPMHQPSFPIVTQHPKFAGNYTCSTNSAKCQVLCLTASIALPALRRRVIMILQLNINNRLIGGFSISIG